MATFTETSAVVTQVIIEKSQDGSGTPGGNLVWIVAYTLDASDTTVRNLVKNVTADLPSGAQTTVDNMITAAQNWADNQL